MPEAPRKLKPGWRMVRFGDVVRQCKEDADAQTSGLDRYIAGEHMETDDLRIRRWGTIGDGYLGPAFHRRFRKGQVLYGSRRTYLRKIAVPDFEGICANTTFVLEPKSPDLLPELLPFLMQTASFTAHSVKQSKGSVNPYINFSDLAWFEFPLPPLAEQQPIAELLSQVDTAAYAFDAASNALATVHLAALNREASTWATGDVPRVLLGDHVDVKYGITQNAGRESLPARRPYLRVANVQRYDLDLAEVKVVGVSDPDLTSELQLHDLLIVEGHADPAELGRAAMWQEEVLGCLHQNHLIRVRPGASFFPWFLLEYLNSPEGKAYFRSRAKTTSGLNTLNSTVVKEMPVPMPAKVVQHQIASRLTQMRRQSEQIRIRSLAVRGYGSLLRSRILGV